MRIFAFILLALIAITIPFHWFIFSVFVYLIFWTGYEVLVIGIMIDSMFGIGNFAYLYTVCIGMGVVAAELIRPYISWYDTDITSV
jgi:hypothetical protein